MDIGAGVGYNTTIFSQVVSPEFKVYAFEPDESNYVALKEIIERRMLREKIIVVKAAIGETERTVRFWHNEKHLGDNRVFTESFAKYRADLVETHIIPLYSIDGFAEQKIAHSSIKFIKIDVQGYELPVCHGMQKTIKVNPNIVIALEYDPANICEMGFQPQALLNFFQGRDFFTYRIHKSGRLQLIQTREELDEQISRDKYINLLFCKERVN